jgi:hypothetical protein
MGAIISNLTVKLFQNCVPENKLKFPLTIYRYASMSKHRININLQKGYSHIKTEPNFLWNNSTKHGKFWSLSLKKIYFQALN